ncbi:2-hydroxyacyl-CoA dehydratase family protein [Chloroflexota bacterium]
MDKTANDRKELERLRRQLEDITAKRDKLLVENRRLCHEFGRPQKPNPANGSDLVSATSSHSVNGTKPATALHVVNNRSPLSEKVKLFRSPVTCPK